MKEFPYSANYLSLPASQTKHVTEWRKIEKKKRLWWLIEINDSYFQMKRDCERWVGQMPAQDECGAATEQSGGYRQRSPSCWNGSGRGSSLGPWRWREDPPGAPEKEGPRSSHQGPGCCSLKALKVKPSKSAQLNHIGFLPPQRENGFAEGQTNENCLVNLQCFYYKFMWVKKEWTHFLYKCNNECIAVITFFRIFICYVIMM